MSTPYVPNAAEFEAARLHGLALRNQLTDNGNEPVDAIAHFSARFAELAFIAGIRYAKEQDHGVDSHRQGG